jgi:L-threonylcarbamoyladenylate synthase
MPGPVTLVLPDGKGSTFGFRIPDHPFILSLLKHVRIPLASTSANRSGSPAALDVPGALASLDGEPDLSVDGGAIPTGSLASTVIRVEQSGAWRILRPGPVTEEMLRTFLEKTEETGS